MEIYMIQMKALGLTKAKIPKFIHMITRIKMWIPLK